MSGEQWASRGPEGRKAEAARRDARAQAAGYANYGAMWRALNPDKVNRHKKARNAARKSARAAGTNPRATKTNPRAKGTNPAAGLDSDLARVGRVLRRALARHRASTGTPWCPTCDDSGFTYTDGAAAPCPSHRPMTTADADAILRPD